MEEVRSKVIAGVKFSMAEEEWRVGPAEMVSVEAATAGFFAAKQMRKTKKSSDYLYQWFHISQIAAAKQKHDITDCSTKSEEVVASKREVPRQMLKREDPRHTELARKCTSNGLMEGLYSKSDTVADNLETEGPFPYTLNGQGLVDPRVKKFESRRCSSTPEPAGIESYRSSQQTVPRLANQFITDSKCSELDNGNSCYPENALIDHSFKGSKHVTENIFLSICDYVYKPSTEDTKEKGKDFIKRRNIYVTEQDSRDSPELALMQEQLHRLVAPTAENINLIAEQNPEKLVDPDSIDKGECQINFIELALKRPEMLEQSRQISGDSAFDNIHIQQLRKRNMKNALNHQRVSSFIGTPPTGNAETENVLRQTCVSFHVPQQQHNTVGELRTEGLAIKNSKKESLSTEVQCWGNSIDQGDKERVRKGTLASEPNSNQPAKLITSTQFAKSAESPAKMISPEVSLKSHVNHEGKPGIEVKVLHIQRAKIGASDAKWGSRGIKTDGEERFEQIYERLGSSGEKIESTVPSEQTTVVTKSPTAHIQSSIRTVKERILKDAVNEADSLASEKTFQIEVFDEQAKKSAASAYCKKMQSTPTSSSGKGEKPPQWEIASAETFNGLKKILERKLDLHYAVLAWKEYYERKRKREAEMKETILRKQTTLALTLEKNSSERYQLDTVPADVPVSEHTATMSGVSILSKSSPLDSQKVREYNAKFKKYHNGIAPHLSRDVHSTNTTYSKNARDEGVSADKLEYDFYQGRKVLKGRDSGNSLTSSNYSAPENNNEDQCSSAESLGSDISLDFYTSLHNASLDAKKYSENVALKRIMSAYRSDRDVLHSLYDDKKTSPDELSGIPYEEEFGLEKRESRMFSKINTHSSRTAEEGLTSGILDNGTSTVGRHTHRSPIRSSSKANQGPGDSGWIRNERSAANQTTEEGSHKSRSVSKSRDASISFRRTRKQVSPDYRLSTEMEDNQPAKESSNMTKCSPSRKRSTGLMDFRISNNGAVKDARHKARSSERCSQ